MRTNTENFLSMIQNSISNSGIDGISSKYQYMDGDSNAVQVASQNNIPVLDLTEMQAAVGMSHQRIVRYKDYAEMIEDNAIIAAALETYADNATQTDYNEGHIVTVETGNETLKEEIEHFLYKKMDVDSHGWSFIKQLVKDGDIFGEIVLEDDLKSVSYVRISEYSEAFHRIEKDGKLVCWIVENEQAYASETQKVENYFSNNTYDYINSFMSKKGLTSYRILAPFQVVHGKLNTIDKKFKPYGKSILEIVRKVWKEWRLMENVMLINCINNAPERLVFGIPVGEMDPQLAMKFVDGVRQKHRKTPIISETGEISERASVLAVDEHVYLPLRSDGTSPTVDKLAGTNNLDGVTNVVNYFKDKVLVALKMPPNFNSLESVDMRKTPLANIDVQFARTIQRIQRDFISFLMKPLLVDIFLKGYSKESVEDLKLFMTPPNAVVYAEQQESIQNKYSLANDIKQTGLVSEFYIQTNILNLTEEEAILEGKRKKWEEEGLTVEEGRMRDELKTDGFNSLTNKLLGNDTGSMEHEDSEGGGSFESFGNDEDSMDMSVEPLSEPLQDSLSKKDKTVILERIKTPKTNQKNLSKQKVREASGIGFQALLFNFLMNDEFQGINSVLQKNNLKDKEHFENKLNEVVEKLEKYQSINLNEGTEEFDYVAKLSLQKDMIEESLLEVAGFVDLQAEITKNTNIIELEDEELEYI